MVVRYQERFQEMMAQAEVSPEAMLGLLDRLETFVHPFCASLGSRRATPRRGIPHRVALPPGSQDRRGDRLSARPGSPTDATLHRPGRLGPSALAGDPRRSRSASGSVSRTG